jgi:hypothetical protein
MSAPHPAAPASLAPRAPLAAAFQPPPTAAGPPPPRERAIIHLDMDCFFAAVAAVGRPEFAGLPLAVCHSNSDRGSGEVSSANYEARAHGVGAGMFMSEAKRRCPALVVVPYEFDRYEEIAMEVREWDGSGDVLAGCLFGAVPSPCSRQQPPPPQTHPAPHLATRRCTASSCAPRRRYSRCPATRRTSTSPGWATQIRLRGRSDLRSSRRPGAPPAAGSGPTP